MLQHYFNFPKEEDDYFSYLKISDRCQKAIEKNNLTWLPDLILLQQDLANFKDIKRQKWLLERKLNSRKKASFLAITCYCDEFLDINELPIIQCFSLEIQLCHVEKFVLVYREGLCFLEEEMFVERSGL